MHSSLAASLFLYCSCSIPHHADHCVFCTAGKVLSYHSASDTEEIISVSSSVATPLTRNGNRARRAWSSSRLTQMLSISFLAAIIVAGLSSFSIDANNDAHRLQTTVAKIADKIILGVQQNMMNADLAAVKASASQIVFWDPFLEDASTNNENLMSIVSLCSARPTFMFRMEEPGSYALQPIEAMKPLQIQDLPMAIFTPNFSQAALERFDDVNQGAFMIMLRDPIDIYLEQYEKAKEIAKLPDSKSNDNLIVRYLSGMNHKNRKVNGDDYDVARQVLMSKFVIVSCDDPEETLRRVVQMTGFSRRDLPECRTARQRWNQECRKTKQIGQQNKKNISHQEMLRNIESDHHFDILLYEDSKVIFHEQNAFFGR